MWVWSSSMFRFAEGKVLNILGGRHAGRHHRGVRSSPVDLALASDVDCTYSSIATWECLDNESK